jgi:hypothetical protein
VWYGRRDDGVTGYGYFGTSVMEIHHAAEKDKACKGSFLRSVIRSCLQSRSARGHERRSLHYTFVSLLQPIRGPSPSSLTLAHDTLVLAHASPFNNFAPSLKQHEHLHPYSLNIRGPAPTFVP